MPVPALVAARPTTSSRSSVLTRRSSPLLLQGAVHALVLVLAALMLVASPSAPSRPSGAAPVVEPEITRVASTADKIRNALRIAKNQVGDPYRYGAAGPNAFDCSGLLYYSTRRAGFSNMPRTSSAQARFTRKISRSAMRPGDFVFMYDGGGVYHASIFVGWHNGRRQILHAGRTGTDVKRDPIWTDKWFPGTLRR